MKEAYQYRGKYRKRGVEKEKSLIDAMNEAIKKMEEIKPQCAYTLEEMIHLMKKENENERSENDADVW